MTWEVSERGLNGSERLRAMSYYLSTGKQGPGTVTSSERTRVWNGLVSHSTASELLLSFVKNSENLRGDEKSGCGTDVGPRLQCKREDSVCL